MPSPCEREGRWIGVGHRKPAGGGPRNPFGLDFANNDHVSAFSALHLKMLSNSFGAE